MTTDTPTPRVDAIALRLNGKTGLWCDDESLAQYNDLVDEARTIERDLTACRAALRELVACDDILQEVIAAGRANPHSTKNWPQIHGRNVAAWSAARAILQSAGEGEGK